MSIADDFFVATVAKLETRIRTLEAERDQAREDARVLAAVEALDKGG